MRVLIPESAVRACLVTGSIVYVVLNTSGQFMGLFVQQSGRGVAALAEAVVGSFAGTVAGVMTAELVKHATHGYFVPAIQVGSQASSVGVAAGAGLAAGLLVTLYHHGSHFVIQAAQKFQTQELTPIDYDEFFDDGFSVLTLQSVLGNLPEPPAKIDDPASSKD